VALAPDREHLAECARCAEEMVALTRAAAVGRSTFGAGELSTPDPRVWSRIVEELAIVSEPVAPVAPTTTRVPPLAPAAVVALRPRRRGMLALVAAVVAVILVGGGGAAWLTLRPTPDTVLATATLQAFPDWRGATGTATVDKRPDGTRVIKVTCQSGVLKAGYREVWLITADAKRLVSLGNLRGTTGSFVIPAGVDISRYDLVDVSDEPYDGNPDHSGDSIVRGKLVSVA
jgi:hypothetical protein